MFTTGIPNYMWVILGIVNILMYFRIAKGFFRDWDGFLDSLRFWLIPNRISFRRGVLADDISAERKLLIWIIFCFSIVFGEAKLIGLLFL